MAEATYQDAEMQNKGVLSLTGHFHGNEGNRLLALQMQRCADLVGTPANNHTPTCTVKCRSLISDSNTIQARSRAPTLNTLIRIPCAGGVAYVRNI